MRRTILSALLSVPLLVSPLFAAPQHGGSNHHGDGHHNQWHGGDGHHGEWHGSSGHGWGWGPGVGWGYYGLGFPYRSWYGGSTYVAPTYVLPDYGTTYQVDAEALVNAWYHRYLGRDMDPGAAGWMDKIRIGGEEPSAVLSGILASPEYYQRGGGTPSGFVNQLYADVAGRQPSRGEMGVALNRLGVVDRQGVAYDVLRQHPEAVMIQ